MAADVPPVAEVQRMHNLIESIMEGLVYNLQSGYGETNNDHGVGPSEKKNAVCFTVSEKQETRTKNCALLRVCYIEL